LGITQTKTLSCSGRVFTLRSYAKLNLSLLVYKPNKSGYHPICSVFQEISLSDQLKIQFTSQKDCVIRSNDGDLPTDHTNLLAQVYYQFKSIIPYGMLIDLQKNIPIGGGLGGGSSNAGALIRFLIQSFSLSYSDQQQIRLAKSLGSDIPFFLKGGTQLVRGIGEKCQRLPAKAGQFYVLVIPDISINTAAIFHHYDCDRQKNPLLPATRTPQSILRYYKGPNTLKETVFRQYPLLKDVEDQLLALGTPEIHLSGTGSTLFFYTSTWKSALQWKERLTNQLKSCTVTNCQIYAVKPIRRK